MRRALWLFPIALVACTVEEPPPADTEPGLTTATLSSGESESSDASGDGDPSTTAPTTTATTDPTSTMTSTGDGDGDGPLPCDPDFSFTPNAPGTGSLLNVGFTDTEPLAYVDLQISGPGVAAKQFADITATDPWTWNWTVTDLAPGVWTFRFGAGETWVELASCQVEVVDTGLPQPLPMGACDAQVCGDPDGLGGTCMTCPMVGECLDPPAPYNPNGPGEWSCLDNAGCSPDDGKCTIWCPGEPCNNEAHPDGCPQGVESCYVDASITSYAEACKTCCESRYHQPTGEYACWDQAHSLCRYPTDCGLPLW